MKVCYRSYDVKAQLGSMSSSTRLFFTLGVALFGLHILIDRSD